MIIKRSSSNWNHQQSTPSQSRIRNSSSWTSSSLCANSSSIVFCSNFTLPIIFQRERERERGTALAYCWPSTLVRALPTTCHFGYRGRIVSKSLKCPYHKLRAFSGAALPERRNLKALKKHKWLYTTLLNLEDHINCSKYTTFDISVSSPNNVQR